MFLSLIIISNVLACLLSLSLSGPHRRADDGAGVAREAIIVGSCSDEKEGVALLLVLTSENSCCILASSLPTVAANAASFSSSLCRAVAAREDDKEAVFEAGAGVETEAEAEAEAVVVVVASMAAPNASKSFASAVTSCLSRSAEDAVAAEAAVASRGSDEGAGNEAKAGSCAGASGGLPLTGAAEKVGGKDKGGATSATARALSSSSAAFNPCLLAALNRLNGSGCGESKPATTGAGVCGGRSWEG